MNKILDRIITRTKKDLEVKKKLVSLAELKKRGSRRGENAFYKSLISSENNPAIIAEIKFASPSAGNLADSSSLIERIKAYEASGADSISVITEPHFFKGSLEFLKIVKEKVSLPVLMKDFVIDDYQIYEAKATGADALLLIARLIDAATLSRFIGLCLELGIEPVVEIYSKVDLKKAIRTKTRIIAVNSRDLDTFDINIDKACSLIQKIPDNFIRLGFSGIESANEVSQYKKAGVRGVLIGTSLMKTNNVKSFFKSISQPTLERVKVKICGIRDLDSALAAIDAGADFIGFNFVGASKRFISPGKALEIINEIRGKVKIVGVFQNESIDKVNEIIKLLQLDYVQLHGREDLNYIKKMTTKVIKKVEDDFEVNKKSLENLEYLLIDRTKQGLGKMVDSEKAKNISAKFSSFVAGGLTPENVAEVVKKIKPFAVDVAGGVETEGKKDYAKLKAFVKNAKGKSL